MRDPFSWYVVSAMLLGAILAAGWSITRSGSDAVPVVGPVSDPGTGWSIDPARRWERSLVRITADRCTDHVQGTGVVVDGRVWTNRHVVAGATHVRVTWFDGVVTDAESWSLAGDPDVAVVDVAEPREGLEFSVDDAATRTSGLTVAGFPGGGDLLDRPTAVTGTRRGWGDRDPARPLLLDVEVVPGESGSPVVDHSGDVVALVYARSEPDGSGLAIGAAELASTTFAIAGPADC